MVLNNIDATFEFDPCTKNLVTPRLPVGLQDVNRQQYEMVILGVLDPYQHNEIIKPFVSFQLSKLS